MAGGRPLSCIEFYPHNPQRSLEKILKVCREEENVKRNMLEFASSLRGAITKKNGKIWEKLPKGGGELKKQMEIPNFNLGIVKTQGGRRGLDFLKMSEL